VHMSEEVATRSQDNIDMDTVVRLAVESGVQSLAAIDCSKQRKRKREKVLVNGSVNDMFDTVGKNKDSLENGEDTIPKKKRKKLTPAQHVVSDNEEKHNAVAASEHPAVTAGSESQSEYKKDDGTQLEDEIEIWIPYKKYKGPLKDAYAKSAEKETSNLYPSVIKEPLKLRSAKLAKKDGRKIKCNSPKKDGGVPFMTFVSVDKTPTALVRRRNKLSQSEPKQLHRSVRFLFILQSLHFVLDNNLVFLCFDTVVWITGRAPSLQKILHQQWQEFSDSAEDLCGPGLSLCFNGHFPGEPGLADVY